MKTKFKKRRFVAFSVLLWLGTIGVLLFFILLNKVVQGKVDLLPFIIFVFVASCLSILFFRWLNRHWFNLKKIEQRTNKKLTFAKQKLEKIEKMTQNPATMADYVKRCGYFSTEKAKKDREQEKNRIEILIFEKKTLLEEIKNIPEKSFWEHAKYFFTRRTY